MKNKRLVWTTVTLLIVSALLLSGSMVMLAAASENQVSLPEDSAVPDISEIADLPDEGVLPVGVTLSQIKEENGKQVAVVLSEEEMTLLAERRANGEWLTLSMEEMVAAVKDTVDLFYNNYRIDVGTMTDGVYSVKSYNGYLYYTSEAYVKQEQQTAPRAKDDVFAIILARISAYNDSISETNAYGICCAYADMPRLEERQVYEHVYLQEDDNWTLLSFDYLKFDAGRGFIEQYTHDRSTCYKSYHDECCECVKLFYDDVFEKEFVEPQFVEGTRRVRVEIFEEATQTLVDTFTLTDQEEVNAIFEAFFTSFQKACDEFEAHVASDEDKAYRSTYRIVVHMESTYENVTMSDVHDIDICYPYGYSNDIYGYLHFDLWMDYLIQGGHDFIELVDVHVGQHIPA